MTYNQNDDNDWNDNMNYDWIELIKRIFKYLIYGLVVAIAAKYIPAQKLTTREIVMISIIASITFAILDMYTPSVAKM
jgi:hypothetical protein